MSAQEIVSIVAPFLGLAAPVLIYLAARQRLTHDARRDTAEDEAGLWERMSTMLDRYGKRADELEEKVRQAEANSQELRNEVASLRGSMARWRNYAMALVRQIQAAKLTPLNPADFGLGEDD
jgi:Mg2+ and Co2+ transporter CorA